MDDMNNEFCEAFKNVLNVPFYSSYYANNHGSFEIEIRKNSDNFTKTPYFYDSKKELLHFTSISALFSIIQEQSIRMYNMNISNDENEYTYAANIFKPIYEKLGFDGNKLDNYYNNLKTRLYYLSLSTKKNLGNTELWEKYGDNHKGIAIEFSIESQPEKWIDFFYSKVQYDKKFEFSPLFNVWDKIISKYPQNIYNINISPLLAFNKNKDWDVEEEIRLLMYDNILYNFYEFGDIRNYIYNDFRSDETRVIKEIKYFKLPLYNMTNNKPYIINTYTNNEDLGIYPLLKIENIYFGNYWGGENYLKTIELYNRLNYLIIEKLGYRLPEFNQMNIIN